MEQVAQHLQFARGQVALAPFAAFAIGRLLVLMLVDGLFELGAQAGVAAFVEQFPDRAPQAAATVRVSRKGVAISFVVGHRPCRILE